jgi:hypothetical protein
MDMEVPSFKGHEMRKQTKEITGIDIPLPKDRSWHFPAKAVAVVLVVGVLLWAGGEIRPVHPKLPANQSCLESNQAVKEAAKAFSSQLVAAIDGVDAPAPDLSKVKSASVACVENQGHTTVNVEVAK